MFHSGNQMVWKGVEPRSSWKRRSEQHHGTGYEGEAVIDRPTIYTDESCIHRQLFYKVLSQGHWSHGCSNAVFSCWHKRDTTAFHCSLLASLYFIDVGTMIFRPGVRFHKLVTVFIYMVDEPSTKVVTRKNEFPNKVSGPWKTGLHKWID